MSTGPSDADHPANYLEELQCACKDAWADTSEDEYVRVIGGHLRAEEGTKHEFLIRTLHALSHLQEIVIKNVSLLLESGDASMKAIAILLARTAHVLPGRFQDVRASFLAYSEQAECADHIDQQILETLVRTHIISKQVSDLLVKGL